MYPAAGAAHPAIQLPRQYSCIGNTVASAIQLPQQYSCPRPASPPAISPHQAEHRPDGRHKDGDDVDDEQQQPRDGQEQSVLLGQRGEGMQEEMMSSNTVKG